MPRSIIPIGQEGRRAREVINLARWKFYDREGDENAAGAAWAAVERARQRGNTGEYVAGRCGKGGGKGGGGDGGSGKGAFYGDYDEADEYLGYDDSGDDEYEGQGRSGVMDLGGLGWGGRGRGAGKGGKGGGAGGGKGFGKRAGANGVGRGGGGGVIC